MIKKLILSRTALELLILLGFSCLFAVGTNSLRPDGLPWKADWKQVRLEQALSHGAITTPTAYFLWQSQSAIFIDARSLESFSAGHIPDARSLPYDPFDFTFSDKLGQLPKDDLLVVYCDGLECSKAGEMVEEMRAKGFENVVSMPEGFIGWAAIQAPVEVGQ